MSLSVLVQLQIEGRTAQQIFRAHTTSASWRTQVDAPSLKGSEHLVCDLTRGAARVRPHTRTQKQHHFRNRSIDAAQKHPKTRILRRGPTPDREEPRTSPEPCTASLPSARGFRRALEHRVHSLLCSWRGCTLGAAGWRRRQRARHLSPAPLAPGPRLIAQNRSAARLSGTNMTRGRPNRGTHCVRLPKGG